MKGSAEEKASGTNGNHWEDTVLTWGMAHQMLVLVNSILRDILQGRQRRVQLVGEKELLDRNRLKLAWQERSRRYELHDEICTIDREMAESRAELDRLGVALLDEEAGEVGFPTLVNDKRAFFVWRPTDESLDYWRFEGEPQRRQVPVAWTKAADAGAGTRR
jgi:hypothetical protein